MFSHEWLKGLRKDQGEELAYTNSLVAAGSGRGIRVCVAIVPDGVLPDEFRGKSE